MPAVIAIPAGLLIGLSLGALGGGGSILTVPALVYLLHQQAHTAITGSLLIVGITALAGTAAHWRAGRVRAAQGITFGVIGVAGSYAGSWLSASIPSDLLLALFAVLMVVAAAAMLRRRRPAGQAQPAVTAEAAGAPLPAGGQGRIAVPLSAGQTRAARLGGAVHLDWPLIGVFTLAALAGTLGGNRIASRVSASRLTVAFTVLLIAVAAYTLARSLPALL